MIHRFNEKPSTRIIKKKRISTEIKICHSHHHRIGIVSLTLPWWQHGVPDGALDVLEETHDLGEARTRAGQVHVGLVASVEVQRHCYRGT